MSSPTPMQAVRVASLRHVLPDRWWEEAAGIYLCTFKPDRGYAHVLSLLPKKAAKELAEIAAQGFQAIEIFAPAEGRFGYAGLDMTDPYHVDPELGTMEDFRRFVRLAHGNGLAVVIFLNVGYLSLEAPAWKDACADRKAGRDTEKVRWFSWADSPDAAPPAAPEDRAFAAGVIPPGTPDAPNTWGWQYHEEAGCYYWARWQAQDAQGSWVGLPQTDWGAEDWPREAERIIRCWMETGIDGIIVDAPCCYSHLTWEKNNRHITEVIAGYGNTYMQSEGVGDWAWIVEGGYNCLQDYRLGERLKEALRTGDPRPIEDSLRGYRDLVAGAGGVLYTKVQEGDSREQRRLLAAAIASLGDTLVYGTRDMPGPDEQEQWLLRARRDHAAFHHAASRRKLTTNSDSTHYAFLKTARDGSERVLVVLSFSGAASTVEVDLSGVSAAGLVNLRTGEMLDRSPIHAVPLEAHGYAFFQVLPAPGRAGFSLPPGNLPQAEACATLPCRQAGRSGKGNDGEPASRESQGARGGALTLKEVNALQGEERMGNLRYAVHAYAWTGSWSNQTLGLIDRAKQLGFDTIEIPLMEVELVDPLAIKRRLDAVGIGVCTSTALSAASDITAEDEAGRQRGVAYLKQCVKATAEMGATVFTGVTYSALGSKIPHAPDESYWERAAKGLKETARYAQDLGVTVGIEPVNRYETFLVNTCDQALELREMIGEPNVALHLDAYHMNIEENSFYEPTLKAAPYLCHYHLSESHRGTPGTGLVDWNGIYRALAEAGYQGLVGLESFVEVSPAMAGATCIWRRLADSSDQLLTDGLRYLKSIEATWYR